MDHSPPRDPRPSRRFPIDGQKVRFLIAGGYNTLFGYGVFALLYHWLAGHAHYLAIAVLSHFIAVGNAFLTHKTFVFRAGGPWMGQFLRFNVTSLGTLAFGALLLTLLVEAAHLNPLLSQAITLGITVCASYVLHRRVTFRLPATAGEPLSEDVNKN